MRRAGLRGPDRRSILGHNRKAASRRQNVSLAFRPCSHTVLYHVMQLN
jgi:hypothetical protein